MRTLKQVSEGSAGRLSGQCREVDGISSGWLSFTDVSFLSMTKDKGPVSRFLLLNNVLSENAVGTEPRTGANGIGPLSELCTPFLILRLFGLQC